MASQPEVFSSCTKINKSKRARPLALFIYKVYEMVQDSKNWDAICWTCDGLAILIRDSKKLAIEILPQFFNHCNYSSLIKQLTLYSFKSRKDLQGFRIYQHPNFQQGQKFVPNSFPIAQIVLLQIRDLLQFVQRGPQRPEKSESELATQPDHVLSVQTLQAPVDQINSLLQEMHQRYQELANKKITLMGKIRESEEARLHERIFFRSLLSHEMEMEVQNQRYLAPSTNMSIPAEKEIRNYPLTFKSDGRRSETRGYYSEIPGEHAIKKLPQQHPSDVLEASVTDCDGGFISYQENGYLQFENEDD